MKRLVTTEEIRNLYFSNVRELYLPEGAIITPGARDLIHAFNIKVIYGEPPVSQACTCADEQPKAQAERQEDLASMVARVVESVMAGKPEECKQRVISAVLERLSKGGVSS